MDPNDYDSSYMGIHDFSDESDTESGSSSSMESSQDEGFGLSVGGMPAKRKVAFAGMHQAFPSNEDAGGQGPVRAPQCPRGAVRRLEGQCSLLPEGFNEGAWDRHRRQWGRDRVSGQTDRPFGSYERDQEGESAMRGGGGVPSDLRQVPQGASSTEECFDPAEASAEPPRRTIVGYKWERQDKDGSRAIRKPIYGL